MCKREKRIIEKKNRLVLISFFSEGLYKPFIIIDIIMLPVICSVVLIPVKLLRDKAALEDQHSIISQIISLTSFFSAFSFS